MRVVDRHLKVVESKTLRSGRVARHYAKQWQVALANTESFWDTWQASVPRIRFFDCIHPRRIFVAPAANEADAARVHTSNTPAAGPHCRIRQAGHVGED